MNRSLLVTARRVSILIVAMALPACGARVTVKDPTGIVQPTAAGESQGGDDVAIDDFNEPLAAYGAWVDVAPYGKVWQPSSETVGQDFVPYGTDGQWTASDDGAWVFEGKHDEAFGWATYHYGRWLQHDEHGWVWIPGTTWAPAWVGWRFGGGYVGWAPAGPETGAPQDRSRVQWRRSILLDDGAIRSRPRTWTAVPGRMERPGAPLTETHGSAQWFGVAPARPFQGDGPGTPTASHARKPGKGHTKEKAKAAAKKNAGKAPAKAQAKGKAAKTAKSSAPKAAAAPAAKKSGGGGKKK